MFFFFLNDRGVIIGAASRGQQRPQIKPKRLDNNPSVSFEGLHIHSKTMNQFSMVSFRKGHVKLCEFLLS